MAWRRLSDACLDKITCASFWEDDEHPEDDLIAVGPLIDSSPVPLGPGEGALRMPRRVVREVQV